MAERYETSVRDEMEKSTSGTQFDTEEMRRRAGQIGEKAAAGMEKGRVRTADAMERMASRLESRAGMRSGKGADMMHTAARKLGDTAGYLRTHDTRSMMGDLRHTLRRHPGRAMAAAVAAGFLIGRAMRRG